MGDVLCEICNGLGPHFGNPSTLTPIQVTSPPPQKGCQEGAGRVTKVGGGVDEGVKVGGGCQKGMKIYHAIRSGNLFKHTLKWTGNPGNTNDITVNEYVKNILP